jgi:Flp pilus assembly protein TadG
MVEFAMILPLLVLLTFGIIEFGVAFNASSSVSQSSRAGGRTAAIFSTDPQLEFNAALAAATALDVSKNSINGNPTICVAKYVAGSDPCNQATTYSVQPQPGASGGPVWTIDWGQGPGVLPTGNDNWAVNTRNFGCPQSSGGNPVYDRVIVRVKIDHDLLVPGLFSQFFGNKTSPTITSDSVFQLEPVPTSSCTATP